MTTRGWWLIYAGGFCISVSMILYGEFTIRASLMMAVGMVMGYAMARLDGDLTRREQQFRERTS